MKKKVTKQIMVEAEFCNICEQEITKQPFNSKRIDIIRGLFDTSNFDAHEKCINQVLKEAFEPYSPKK